MWENPAKVNRMRILGVKNALTWKLFGSLLAVMSFMPGLSSAQDNKPTGAPLVLSTIETEQDLPLAYLLPDGKTAKCVTIRLHWNPMANVGPNDDATSFELDLPSDNPGAPLFTAQLWSASLASAMAWQEPWQGARWKVLKTPATDGSGLDAPLAVGMLATSARRPYPDKTVVIGSLNPDGSLGPVSHIVERINAAAEAGMTKVIIPSVQRFDTDASGQVVNIVHHATDLHLECVPADNLVAATESTMSDPLPDTTLSSTLPKYSNEVSTYIDDFAHREQAESNSGLKFAPKEADLGNYPPRLAAIWKSVYADLDAGQQAYRAGQVYVAYQLFSRANARMNGANALAGQNRATFDVKAALAQSDDLRNNLHALMNPPSIDKGGLESSVLVAEMADWAYDINATLEGAQLVVKQTFSQRTDATDAEKDRARETLLFANEQCKYRLKQADFYRGLLDHITKTDPTIVDANASHLLPQLIPAQLATARSFVEGIRQRANDLRVGLLFDPRLVAYMNVLRDSKAEWDARLRKKEMEAEAAAAAAPATNQPQPASGDAPVKLNGNAPSVVVGFDPGNTYMPPHTALAPTLAAKKLTDTALCLIWANTDCEIATLDEKYLRLSGTIDPTTHEWHVKDRARLDALLQAAEIGARHGMSFAEKAEIDASILAMIYERATYLRSQNNDALALEALRNYWRCALLGNVCWQLAHTRKAQPVDLSANPPDKDDKTAKTDDKKGNEKKDDEKKSDDKTASKSDDKTKPSPSNSTNTVVVVPAPIKPTPPAPPVTNDVVDVEVPVAPIATNADVPPTPPQPAPVPVAPVATNTVTNVTPPSKPPVPTPAPTPPAPAPVPVAPAINEADIPVAPIAKVQDYASGEATPPATNAAPVIGPMAPQNKSTDNSDGHSLP